MSVNAPDFEYVRDLMRDAAAIVLEPGKEYLVETRLEPLARSEGFATLGGMVSALRLGGTKGLQSKVVDRMTTNETSFFRDLSPFDALKHTVLPELIARRAQERTLNIWCGACSSGQEPYSIMMLLRDAYPQLADWNISLLATDLSAEMLERARAGVYSQMEINRGLPAPMLVKYFEKRANDWRIVDRVRRGIEFRELNLCRPWSGIPRMDLIFLRNVMIYFAPEAKRTILTQIRSLLRPDGYLFLGGAETTYGLDEAYERVVFGKAAAYRVKG
ncbi:MAG TPA: protein-glutamate O-methyltransferase CheR [Chthoniobacteraceae bacterium]|jgi:chemotaxis protein methyltransferase CheR|nr:protein-glutamate O-methyltransferase CheR [Chthoniobacteraceae bacterium]